MDKCLLSGIAGDRCGHYTDLSHSRKRTFIECGLLPPPSVIWLARLLRDAL
jgi:hypothetical protein